MSLCAYHSHERDVAINTLLKAEHVDLEAYRRKISAITHPLLVDGKNRLTMLKILQCGRERTRVDGYNPAERLFSRECIGMPPDCVVEIQQFLCDPSRSGSCYVDSGMYTALSLWIARLVFERNRSVRVTTFLDSNLFMTLISILKNNEGLRSSIKHVTQLAVDSLPFYMSNADYTSELANYFLNHTFDPETLEDLHPNIQPLQGAIDLYLKVNLASIIISFMLTLPVE